MKIPVKSPAGLGFAAVLIGIATTVVLISGQIRIGKHSSSNSYILTKAESPMTYWVVAGLLILFTVILIIKFAASMRTERREPDAEPQK